MATVFVPNPRLKEEIVKAGGLEKALLARAEAVAEEAKRIGPVGDSPPGEHYVDQIEAVSGVEHGEPLARVNAKKFTSHWIEFGTIYRAAAAPLQRATEMVGLRLKAKRR